jgi:hypothetical protein
MINNFQRMIIGVLMVCAMLAGCTTAPNPVQSVVATPASELAGRIEQLLDVESPLTRVSPVTVLRTEATPDGMLVMYSYDRDRQAEREAMTCVQVFDPQATPWEALQPTTCISNFPANRTVLPSLMTNGSSVIRDYRGQDTVLAFGFATQPAAVQVRARFVDGFVAHVPVVAESFMVYRATSHAVIEIAVLDAAGGVLIREVYNPPISVPGA